MRRSFVVGRLPVIAAILAAMAVVATVLLKPGGPDYVVRARFADASQLVRGNLVQVAGVKVGSISKIRLTGDGQAEVAMKIDDAEYRPLRRGTRAIIRQASLSGVANRYVDLQLPPGDHTATIPRTASSARARRRPRSTSTSSSTRSTRRRARRSAG